MDIHRYYESETITKAYFRFAITYNDEIKNIILENMKKSSGNYPPYDLMVDVGCGSGQATNRMAPYFKKVMATDVSAKQIEYAVSQNKFDHVTYSVGRAEEVEVKDHSVDLLLSAEAAHWFNVPEFLKEAVRILKPTGTLVLMGFTYPKLTPFTFGTYRNELTEYMTNRFQYYMEFGGKYDATRYKELSNKLVNLYEAIRAKNKHSRDVEIVYPEYSLAYIKKYMGSVDCVQNYREFKANEIREKKGTVTEEDLKPFDVTEKFGREVKEKLGMEDMSDEDIKFRAVFEVFVHVADGLSIEDRMSI